MNVVRIKIRIVRGIIFHNNRIFKTNRFKSNIPIGDSQLHILPPFFRDSRIDIPYNRFYRLHQFPGQILIHILRLQVPTINYSIRLQPIVMLVKQEADLFKETDPFICIPGHHGSFWQNHNIARFYRGQGPLFVCCIGHHAFHDDIILECLEVLDPRTITLKGPAKRNKHSHFCRKIGKRRKFGYR